jgi:hypothetical protein
MFNKGARLWALGARLWAGKKGKAGILNHEIPEIRKRGRGRLNRKEHKDHRDRQGFEMADRSGFWLGVIRRRVLAPLPGCGVFGGIYRGWSLRSTPGYFLATLRVGQAVMSLLRSLKIIIGAAFSTNMSPLTGLGDGRGGDQRMGDVPPIQGGGVVGGGFPGASPRAMTLRPGRAKLGLTPPRNHDWFWVTGSGVATRRGRDRREWQGTFRADGGESWGGPLALAGFLWAAVPGVGTPGWYGARRWRWEAKGGE